jgi:hypothetical protein
MSMHTNERIEFADFYSELAWAAVRRVVCTDR